MSSTLTHDLSSANETLASEASPGALATGCPRCGSTDSWGMSSWCPGCGYYPAVESVDEDRMGWRAEAAEASAENAPEAEATLLNCIPLWMWATVAGVLTIFSVSVVASKSFSHAASARSYWAWTELIAGFTAAFAAHCCAAWTAKKSDSRMNLLDILVNWMAVWQPTMTRLPRGAVRLWGFVWGLTAMICSVAIIGGHDTSMFFKDKYEPPKSMLPSVVNGVAAAAKASAGKTGSLEDALRDVGDAGTAGAGDEATDNADDPSAGTGGSEVLCAIFGMQLNRHAQPTHFLLMGQVQGKLQYVATVKADSLSRPELATVAQRLSRTNQPRPAVPTRYAAVWVQPRIACRVEHSGISSRGTLINPRVAEVQTAEWRSASQDSSSETPPHEDAAPGANDHSTN